MDLSKRPNRSIAIKLVRASFWKLDNEKAVCTYHVAPTTNQTKVCPGSHVTIQVRQTAWTAYTAGQRDSSGAAWTLGGEHFLNVL